MIFITLIYLFFITPALIAEPQNLITKLSAIKTPQKEYVTTFHVEHISIAGQTIIRKTPIIDGIATEGATQILDANKTEPIFYTHIDKPPGVFRLNAAEGVEKALINQPYSLIKNPYVENINGIFEPIWLMHFDELRPAFKVRPPTISPFDLKDIYIDAESGDVLRIDDVVQQVQALANLFVYSPSSNNLDQSLRPVILKNLVSVENNGYLHGEYIDVRTCCKYYTCPNGGTCSDQEKKCAYKSHENAMQHREIIEISTDTLGLDPIIPLPPTLTIDTVRCTYLPFAKASYKNGSSSALGFFERPIDNESSESEMDRFSEVQAYFSISSFFNHIRFLLNDPTWCLREQAMSCNKDGSPVLDENKYPKNPYRVFVNQMIPDTKMDTFNKEDSENLLNQILSGRGSKNNPIKVDSFARMGNAAFIPALSTLKKTTPRADEILSDLIKDYDHNVFFQGAKDFAYDGDVVFHEFMHAIATSLIGKMNTFGLDQWGINSEPGSLNEAWADYFAAAFTNKPTIGQYASTEDGYGETGIRNLDNHAACPDDVIGESHHDGLIWSGALWEIRSSLISRLGKNAGVEFDRAVLASLTQAAISDDFKQQSQKLIQNIKQRTLLNEEGAQIAQQILDQRGLTDCFRAFTLSTVDKKNHLKTRIKDHLFVPSKNQIGLKNFAPATSQLEIGVPAGTKKVRVLWRQYLAGTGSLLGTEVTPNKTKNSIPLSIAMSQDIPMSWQFKNAYAQAFINDQEIEETPRTAEYNKGFWSVSMQINLEPCEQKTLYMSFLSNDHKYVLENIHVQFEQDERIDNSGCEFKGSRRITNLVGSFGCTQQDGSIWSLLFALVSINSVLYRRRKRQI